MTNIHPLGKPLQHIDLGHSRVPYYRLGHGPDVLFIHGWPLHAATFRHIAPRLADRFTCHLFDLPGTGQSEWSEASEISILDHVQSTRRVVDALGLSDYAIVAHDSGAVIARHLAASDARVRGLVLGNSEIPGYHPWQLKLLLALEQIPFGPLGFGLALQVPMIRDSNAAYGGCFHDPRFIHGEYGDLFIRPMTRSARVTLGQRRLLQGFDWRVVDALADAHRSIRAPVQLVWGAQDPYFPLERLKPTLTQYAGGARLTLIDPGKLFAHEEFPAAFAEAARGFLERCWPASVRAVS
jgi:haloalkane dehalogenase